MLRTANTESSYICRPEKKKKKKKKNAGHRRIEKPNFSSGKEYTVWLLFLSRLGFLFSQFSTTMNEE